MITIKKDYQTFKIIKRDLRGDFLISIENSIAKGCILKAFITLSKKELDDIIENTDKMLEEKNEPTTN